MGAVDKTSPFEAGKVHWKDPEIAEGQGTKRSGNFLVKGVSYTVSVAYDRQAVKAKYGVGDEEVDKMVEQMVAKIGADHLKGLTGHTLRTSLSGAGDSIRFKQSIQNEYRVFSEELKSEQPDLYKTITAVREVFKLNRPELSRVSEEKNSDEDDQDFSLSIRQKAPQRGDDDDDAISINVVRSRDS